MRLDGSSDKQPTCGGTVRRALLSQANFSLSCILTLCNSVQNEYHRAENSPCIKEFVVLEDTLIHDKVYTVMYKTTDQ